jgi:hypothetical protein
VYKLLGAYIFALSNTDKQMKPTFYIVLTFMLAFSFGNAQSSTEPVNAHANTTVTVSESHKQQTVETTTNAVILIDASEVKETIARSTSDIKLYFNRLRNVDNLDLLFPKINKAVKA